MVVSINIVNIFSILPWDRVVGTLAYHARLSGRHD